MSLNYTTLQSEILTLAHRADLTTEVVGFIRRCEAMIKRDLVAYPLSITLDESDRSAGGFYTLPSGFLQLRTAHASAADGSLYLLENVGAVGIKAIASTAAVLFCAVHSTTSLEFRGTPAANAEFPLQYLGVPDALTTTATNDLLTYHEDVYIAGGLFELYSYTQDLELAKMQQDLFNGKIEALNEQYGRMIGGATVLPAYNFGQIQIGSGY